MTSTPESIRTMGISHHGIRGLTSDFCPFRTNSVALITASCLLPPVALWLCSSDLCPLPRSPFRTNVPYSEALTSEALRLR